MMRVLRIGKDGKKYWVTVPTEPEDDSLREGHDPNNLPQPNQQNTVVQIPTKNAG